MRGWGLHDAAASEMSVPARLALAALLLVIGVAKTFAATT